MQSFYRFLADVTVFVHFAYIAFVLGGLLCILLGIIFRWEWVRNFWFRVLHLAAMAIVALESLVDFECPLTTLENYLLELSGGRPTGDSFVGRWLNNLIMYSGPDWVFTTVYVALAGFIALIFYLSPPRWPGRRVDNAKVSARPEPV